MVMIRKRRKLPVCATRADQLSDPGVVMDKRENYCGMNSFHLMRTADGWKIVSAASTIELDGCEPEAKEKQ
jgi:hypothetical protein